MEHAEVIQVLDDLQKELLEHSSNISSIILVSDHETGECRYYVTGLIEVQADLVKMLLAKDKVLAANVYLTIYYTQKGS